ncbi:MAG: radical SAM family heme chaperone HemW [Alphaproteobacteria bacterium]|nr:radical SAM family heme chaperone HemW [Alphaproteobacteria bacterium]
MNTALYIHWPFCAVKCPYCDFNVHVAQDIDQARWAVAYRRGLDHYAQLLPDRAISSVYFGGGTPSLMAAETVAAIIAHIKALWPLAPQAEITLEANPTSTEIEKFKAFRAAGINRLSLGIQALNDQALKFLGRKHDAAAAHRAIETARSVFDRFSFDLIAARPGQNLKDWEDELKQAAQLSGGHLSVYHLTIERNTPFYFQHAQGLFNLPDDDLSADLYERTQDILGAAGLPTYEISNHAAHGHQSAHNLAYWHYRDYIGLGPGAHGRLTLNGVKHATREHQAPPVWLDRVENSGSAAHAFEPLSEQMQFEESLMVGLRLSEGISFSSFSVEGETFEKKIRTLIAEGLLERTQTHLRATLAGRMKLNAVIGFLLADSQEQTSTGAQTV